MKRLLMASLLLAAPATAHQAPSGWQYDTECCSQRDCEPVPPGFVRRVQGGYRVTIPPGEHKMVPSTADPIDVFVPDGDRRIRPSGDNDHHACIWGRSVLCIYVGIGGAV